MSSYLRDLPNNAVGGLSVVPQVTTGTVSSPTVVDLLEGDGLCTAQVFTGAIHDSVTATVQAQECATTNGTFSDISGASKVLAGTDDNSVFRVSFQRTLRYARATVTITGTTQSAAVAVDLLEQRKYLGT